MKFIHAADVHLDSPMRGLAAYEGAPVEELRAASRRALGNLVQTALEEGVDLVVLAGDIFDGDWRDYNTGLFFVKTLTMLTRAGVKVVVLAGNHDAASRITRQLGLPEGAFQLDHATAETLRPEELGLEVAVHGQSYSTPEMLEDLSAGYPDPVPGVCNIGVLHTALTGRPDHDNYAPCTPQSLANKGYDYWAPGHVHQREEVSTAPWIVFPGNLQGRHARETGPKGFSVVTVEDGHITGVDPRQADVVRWVRCEVDTAHAGDRCDVLDAVTAALDEAVKDAGDRLVAARVVVGGASKVHDDLRAHHEAFDAEDRSRAFTLGDVWVEKVQVRTCRAVGLAELRERDDAVGELLRDLEHLREHPELLLAQSQYGAAFEPLRSKLPDDPNLDLDDPELLPNVRFATTNCARAPTRTWCARSIRSRPNSGGSAPGGPSWNVTVTAARCCAPRSANWRAVDGRSRSSTGCNRPPPCSEPRSALNSTLSWRTASTPSGSLTVSAARSTRSKRGSSVSPSTARYSAEDPTSIGCGRSAPGTSAPATTVRVSRNRPRHVVRPKCSPGSSPE